MSTSTTEPLLPLDSLPDIDPESHIIAICGVDESRMAPYRDGWLLSDFYLMNNLLRGCGASQAWFTSVAPQKIIESHLRLLHGPPTSPQRIVLDQDTKPTDIVVQEQAVLLNNFLSYFSEKSQQAKEDQRPLLLMVMGHGNTTGTAIGHGPNRTFLKITYVRDIVRKHAGLRCTVIVTSCYSGPWTNIIDISAMAAADTQHLAYSWPPTASGRFNGSVFSSMLYHALEGTNPPSIQPDQINQEPVSYDVFTNLIRCSMLRAPTRGKHSAAFSAQQDDWQTEYHTRSGIPITAFETKFQALQKYSSIPATSQQPSSGAEDAWSTIDARLGSQPRSFYIRSLAEQYLDSNPGDHTEPTNIGTHGLCLRCISGNPLSIDDEKTLTESLLWRQDMEILATDYIRLMELGPFQDFPEWDKDAWLKDEGLRKLDQSIRSIFTEANYLPKLRPVASLDDEFDDWAKPGDYLAAACMKKGLDGHEIRAKLVYARSFVKHEAIEVCERTLGRESRGRTFKTAGKKWLKRLRDASPVKKAPKRQSIGGLFPGTGT